MAESSYSNGCHAEEDEDISIYKKEALSVVTFKIVYSENDLNSKKAIHFKPEMAHQIFGESESIFGYRTLSISLYYLHNSSRCYVDVQKGDMIKTNNMCEPDDIMKCLNPWLPEEYTSSKTEFKKMIENEKHDFVFGEVLHEFKGREECKLFPGKELFPNYKVSMCDTQDENFKDFHRRFETFIVWFIDAANFIDLDDERWMIFYVYEEFEHLETKKTYRSPVGFCTAYKFFAYPNKIRTRISQFFILPSHQRRGIGSKFYRAVIKKIRSMQEVVDITVEEPTATFQKIRDFDDCLAVYQQLEDSKIEINTSNQKRIFEVIRKQKICRRQCQRVYDILGCYSAGKTSLLAYHKYMRNIRNRIAADIEKESRSSKKMCNLERAGIVLERPDKDVQIEMEHKRYIEDIEPSVKFLKQHLATKSA